MTESSNRESSNRESTLTTLDREAFERAITLARTDWGDEVIDDMLRTRTWADVAMWAVGTLQVKNLKLKPWQCPPCESFIVDPPRNVYGFRHEEVQLLRRMLAANISRYDPDPIPKLVAFERAA